MSPDLFERVKTARLDGLSLAYVEEGDGEPVVLVHGSASDLRTWEYQLPALGSAHRTIAYSRRYARPNPDIADDADDPMLPHVEDLVAFLKALGISSAHLVGHSWGGFICLLAAIRHPGVVRSLVLMEPPVVSLFVSIPPRPSELLRVLLRRPALALALVKFGGGAVAPAQKAYRRGDDEAAIRAFAQGVLGKRAFARLPEARRRQVWENRRADRAQLLGAGFPPLSEADVRSVRAPTLVLHGDQSPALFRELARALEALLPNARRVEIRNASHIMHEDNPDQVNEVLERFLSSPP